MAKLMNKSKNILLCGDLEVADSIWMVTKGLLGRASLDANSALWLKSGSSIHTFFMKFPIDIVFVDRNLKVKKVSRDIRPWRFILAPLKSASVFEFSAGSMTENKIEIGDLLHVDC